MPRESVTTKAQRLLVQGRVFVAEARSDFLHARVRGDSGRVYDTGFRSGRWGCTCDHRATSTACSHVVAVRLIFVEPGGTP
jgi:uncharacterized Zn finger protein